MTSIRKIKNNHVLAICIGIVYLWFGILKFFPNQSPAEGLAKDTIEFLTMGLISTNTSILLLAIGETLIGLLLILNIERKKVLILAFVHIILTFTPLFVFSNDAFSNAPFSFTLLGQYIFKNIIIIGALYTLYRLPINQRILS